MFTITNFTRTKYSSLDGKTTVAWQENSGLDKPFEILSKPSGVTIRGELQGEISSMDDLQTFARLVSMAWTEHEKLAPKISRTLSGQ